MNSLTAAGTGPVRITGDTWLIPNSLPAGPELIVPVNSMVITGAEPALIDGESLDIGDRRLHAVLPPLFDSPTTRGVYDDSTGVLWAADCFASLAPGPVHFVEEIPVDLYRETFRALNSMAAPWHALVDRGSFRAHADAVEAMGLIAVASAHGPILTGPEITDGFDRIRALAGAPIAAPPRQATLDALVASAMT